MPLSEQEPTGAISVRHLLPSVGPRSFGLGPVALNLVREQRTLGLDSRIWCLDDARDSAWALEVSGLPPEALVRFPRNGPRFFSYSAALERAVTGDPGRAAHLVHQHGIWTAVSRETHRWRRRYGRPTVIAPHGSLEDWALRRSRWKKRLAAWAYERSNLARASCFHATSAAEAGGFLRFGVRAPIAIVPNGLSDNWLNSSGDPQRFLLRHGVPAGTRVLLYFGRITPVKNLEMLLRAMAAQRSLLPGCLLVVAGTDEFGYRGRLDALVAELRLESFVRFIGYVPSDLKRDAFAAANVFVLPSLREASPIALLEALGAGVPVLTTRGTPWQDVERNRCGWWCEITVDAMAEALAQALTMPAPLLAEWGARAKDLVKREYTWTIAAQRWYDLYRWLVGRAPAPEGLLLTREPSFPDVEFTLE